MVKGSKEERMEGRTFEQLPVLGSMLATVLVTDEKQGQGCEKLSHGRWCMCRSGCLQGRVL